MSTIFVSIASYRDPQTDPTIIDLFNKAKNPDSIFIGLCLQHDNNEIFISPNPNIKILEYNWRESQGTCWARHNIQKLLHNNETYYLQLDSHHRFVKNWDTLLIDTIKELKEKYPKPIIGGYCPGYQPENDKSLEDKPMRINCFSDFSDLGDLMFLPKTIRNYEQLQKDGISTIPARFLSGHFIFSEGSFIQDCPYDPNLYFRGEELSLSARAYTSGYDMFHPTTPIVWHEYIRADQKKHWGDHTKHNGFLTTWTQRSDNGKARARYLLGIEPKKINFGKYGLGKERSLHEYELYSGLKFSTKQVHKFAYDLNNVYPHASLLTEQEWFDGLMKKYKIRIEIPNQYLSEIKNISDLKYISLICENNKGISCYRKDIKKPDLHTLTNNYYIEASMESEPASMFFSPFLYGSGFLNRQTINSFRILS
jgi:hypothetical protein